MLNSNVAILIVVAEGSCTAVFILVCSGFVIFVLKGNNFNKVYFVYLYVCTSLMSLVIFLSLLL